MTAERPLVVAVTALPGAEGGPATAAAAGVALARAGGDEPLSVVVWDDEPGPRRRPTLVSSAAARELEQTLRPDLPAVARGALCAINGTGCEPEDVIELCHNSAAAVVVVNAGPPRWRSLIDSGRADAAILRADTREARPLAALAARDLIASGVTTGIVPRPPGLVAARRALAGIEPGGELGSRSARFARRVMRAQDGQSTPAALFLALAVIVAGVFLAILGGAATGASRFQRATDLAAVSAARSMRDNHHRLFLPAALPSGLPNPAHLSGAEYRQRATEAAHEAAVMNDAEDAQVQVTFPGSGFAPTRVRVEVRAVVQVDGSAAGEIQTKAVAEAYPLMPGTSTATTQATGGGYSGPLATRQGEGMRPDVAKGFDAMARAAAAAGHALIVNSGFRSDAEQAALFAANPDPRMVARPGTSLHRCGTELDLGPPSAYEWLAANAQRFGFVQRYSWEAWHYGFVRGPAPCSAAGDQVSTVGDEGDGAGSSASLPGFVPAQFREPIARASSRWNVPANVLAAQLLAESNFNPLAVSPAGASGIAQFMPATAASYGLSDPFNPAAAIDAQGHLMSDLLEQFGDVSLALAAYNAGPAPVAACSCIPPYPETQAYVSRILGLMGGVGAIAPPALEVRLVG